MKRNTSAFTIVELLIVIVVIAILAAISIVAYNGIQNRAYNSQRIHDLNAISKALELHYVDNGRYPTVAGPGAPTTCLSSSGWNCWGAGSNTNRLVSIQYSSTMPQDPQYVDIAGCDHPNTFRSRMYGYAVSPDGSGYRLGTYIPGLSTSDSRYFNTSSSNIGCLNFVNYLIRKNY
jgi:prepilin-type N-terminal cleavage/methylation domain-containing protein